MNVEIEAASKPLNRGDGARLRVVDPCAARAATVEAAERPRIDGEHLAAELMVPRQEIAQPERQAQHPLPHRHRGEHVIDEVCGTLGHPPPATARTDRARFAGEWYEALRVACVAAKAREPSGPHAAPQELAELALDECGYAAGALCGLQKGREMRAHDAVEDGVLGGAGAIGVDRRARRTVRMVPRCRRGWRHRIRIARGAWSRDRYE